MIIGDSTYALTSKQLAGRSQNDRNEIMDRIAATTAAEFIQKEKNLFTAILELVVSDNFRENFR